MSKNAIVQNLINIAASNGIEASLRDALNEREEAKDTSILEQKWRHDRHGDGTAGAIYDPDGNAPDLREYYDEIAAMPDAYRALVEIRDLPHYTGGDSREARRMVDDALKKAGIE